VDLQGKVKIGSVTKRKVTGRWNKIIWY
jgi:hypothetical protein